MYIAISCLVMLLACTVTRVNGAVAVMSIDFGSQFMKVAIVKPGIPMEIALNRESDRKTPTAIFIRRDERVFGSAALMAGVRYPKNLYQFFIPLLGKSVDHQVVREYSAAYPFYEIKAHPEAGTVVFQHDAQTQFSVEELTAMLLENARDTAEHFTDMSVNDAVVSIPAYWGQTERRALVRAANMTGLNILQIMSSTSAVALHFGAFRRAQFNATRRTFMFYDLGASSSVASVVSYETVQQVSEAGGLRETVPQLTVHGVAFDRTIGTRTFIMRLRDLLVDRFQKQGRTSKKLSEEPKALGKIYSEAEQVFQVLSANTEFTAQIEGLIDELDYSTKVTREDLYSVCGSLFERAVAPLRRALAESNLASFDLLEEIVLFGGGTRIPRIQELAIAASGHRELGRSVNTDEAAALGGVYHAAFLSKAYRVKAFPVREVSPYAIQVEFDRVRAEQDDTDADAASRKDASTTLSPVMKRVLFQRMNVVPQKRVLTFAKHEKDFEFFVNYAELANVDGSASYAEDAKIEREHIGSNVSRVEVVGLTQATAKHAGDSTAVYKGVKAHFRLDDSGLLELTGLEAVFEKKVTVEENVTKSTLERLGDAFSSLFGSTDGATGTPAENTDESEAPKADANADATQKGETPAPATAAEPQNENEKNESAKASPVETEKKLVTKTVVVNEPLNSRVSFVDVPEPSAANRAASRQLIVELRRRDTEKAALEKARNDLESYAINLRERLLNEPAYEKVTTSEERDRLLGEAQRASDWLYEDADDTTPIATFESRLADLQALMEGPIARVRDLDERPKALATLADMINRTESFLVTVHNLTETYKDLTDEDGKAVTGPFTKSEISTFEELISESKQWFSATIEKLRTMDLTSKPTVNSADVYRRVEKLDREVKYLLGRARVFRPPTPKTTPKSDSQKDAEKKPESNESKKDESESADEAEGINLDFPESAAETEAKRQEEEKKNKEQEALHEDETLQLDQHGEL